MRCESTETFKGQCSFPNPLSVLSQSATQLCDTKLVSCVTYCSLQGTSYSCPLSEKQAHIGFVYGSYTAYTTLLVI